MPFQSHKASLHYQFSLKAFLSARAVTLLSMESGKVTMAVTICIMIFMAIATTGANADHHKVGAPAPSPGMESSGVAVYASVVLAAMASLAAWLI